LRCNGFPANSLSRVLNTLQMQRRGRRNRLEATMSAVPIHPLRVVRIPLIALAAGFFLAPHAQAAPLAVSLASFAVLESQVELARPDLLPAPADLSRAARIKRQRAQAVRARRARADRARRIQRARVELAQMQRRGDKHCLRTAVYFEARDEPLRGQRAVAAVILARTKVPGRPKTVCGVVYEGSWRKTGCQFSFTCDGRSDVARWPERWERAVRSADYMWRNRKRSAKIVHGATFYHANYVRPRWSKYMVRVAKIGLHIFYRPRKGRLL
jgi:spore germination cell wall hydrolase CwlJ-like protein